MRNYNAKTVNPSTNMYYGGNTYVLRVSQKVNYYGGFGYAVFNKSIDFTPYRTVVLDIEGIYVDTQTSSYWREYVNFIFNISPTTNKTPNSPWLVRERRRTAKSRSEITIDVSRANQQGFIFIGINGDYQDKSHEEDILIHKIQLLV